MGFVSGVVLRLGDPNIAKHLLREEGEVVVDEVTHHWFAYLRPGAEGVLALLLLVASWVVSVEVAWFLIIVAAGLLAHASWGWLAVLRDRFVITNMRVFRVHGVLSQSLATMPLSRILDISVKKPLHGRLLGFGHFCFEHAALIDAETAAIVAERGAYVVPTMVCLFSLVEQGPEMGLPGDRMDKLRTIYEDSMAGLDVMRSAGVKLAFGTDLLAGFYPQQTREFELRREVFTPVELLRQATSVGAEILMQTGKLGCVKPDAHADLIVVDGDPLADIGLLAADGRNLDLIMRGGEIVKNRLR